MIRRQREYSKEVREMSSNLMSFEVEAFYNFDTIKSFGIAPYYSKKMRWWQGLFKDISLKYNLFTIKNQYRNVYSRECGGVYGVRILPVPSVDARHYLWNHDAVPAAAE